eukprot:767992-Hanusia_phi.AAC.1
MAQGVVERSRLEPVLRVDVDPLAAQQELDHRRGAAGRRQSPVFTSIPFSTSTLMLTTMFFAAFEHILAAYSPIFLCRLAPCCLSTTCTCAAARTSK